MFVPQRNVYDTVVGEDAQRIEDGGLLSASRFTSRHKDPSVFTGESTGAPKSACRVPERLPLSGEVRESSGDPQEESVVGGEDVWGDERVVGFGRSMHLLQDVLWQGLGDPEEQHE